LDLYVLNSGSQDKLWINDGFGNFTENNISADTDFSFGSSVFDADNDGDIDLYVANATQQNKLWINDGFGNFTENNISADTNFSVAANAFDADNDGDMDLYVANFQEQNKLWIKETVLSYSSASPYIQPTTSQPFSFSID
jgi:Tol biopolymer transport system component